jgi:hypothetical protein
MSCAKSRAGMSGGVREVSESAHHRLKVSGTVAPASWGRFGSNVAPLAW